jgi:hypothetical protein
LVWHRALHAILIIGWLTGCMMYWRFDWLCAHLSFVSDTGNASSTIALHGPLMEVNSPFYKVTIVC